MRYRIPPMTMSMTHVVGRHNLLSLDQCGRKPVQTFVKTITGSSATRLNVPLTVRRTESVQSKLVRHFCRAHGVGKILFVGKYQENGVAQFVFVQHSVQFITGSIDTIRVIRVNHKDKTLRVLVVVAPQWTDLILTTYVPHCKRNVLVFNSLDVESNRRNRGDNCGGS